MNLLFYVMRLFDVVQIEIHLVFARFQAIGKCAILTPIYIDIFIHMYLCNAISSVLTSICPNVCAIRSSAAVAAVAAPHAVNECEWLHAKNYYRFNSEIVKHVFSRNAHSFV